MTPAKLVWSLAVAAALALAVTYQSAAMLKAGYRMQELRAQVNEQLAERSLYQVHLSKLSNPGRIRQLVEWLGLDLQEPVVVRAEQPPEAPPAPTPVAGQPPEGVQTAYADEIGRRAE